MGSWSQSQPLQQRHWRVNPVSTGSVVLITGAAGGLGRALVAEFSAAGFRVAAAGHSAMPGEATDTLWPTRLEVTQAADVHRVIDEIERRWGRLDVLVNNAGVCADRLLAQMTDDDWDRVLDVDLKGPFLCCRAVVPLMARQRSGLIVNVVSDVARRGGRGRANYAAAKAGLIGLTLSLARELGGDGIRVNAVVPGFMPTPMTADLDPAQVRQFEQSSVLGMLGDPQAAARFIVDLAAHPHLSGQVLQVDGRIHPWA